MKKLLVIDGNSILNRAFYGVKLLSNRNGLHTNAIFGMINIIMRQIEAVKPDYAAVAFDLKAPTFRHKMYDAYKAGRHAMPDELREQFPYAKRVLCEMGLSVLEMEGYEADDILGTLATQAEERGVKAYILTGDRDSLQLITDSTTVLLVTNHDTLKMDRAAFVEKYGVDPSQFVDVKALMGDSSDNIPGVAGVGEKTALKLISDFGSLDNIYANIPSDKIGKSVNAKLEASKENAYLSRTLVQICTSVPLESDFEELTYTGFGDGAYDLFAELEFAGFIKKYGLSKSNEKITDNSSKNEEQIGLFNEIKEERSEKSEREHITVTLSDLLAIPKNEPLALSFENDRLYAASESAFYEYADTSDTAREFLCDGERSFILHDCKSAYHRLAQTGFENCSFDIMLAAYVLNAGDGSFDLPRLAMSNLCAVADESAPTAPLIFDIYKILKQKIEEDHFENLFYNIEMPLSTVLFEMEQEGFTIERDGLMSYGKALDAIISDLAERIYAYAGREFNINSPKQLGEVLFETLMLPHGKKTKTGYSTNADVLDKLRTYHPIIEDILEYRQVIKLKGTYVDGFIKLLTADNKIHTTFKQTGTATGRLSSAEPNLQNIPIRTQMGRELRHYFIPKSSDYVLIDADYSQIELRLLAAISGDENMIGAFLSGVDIHTSTASNVFHVPEAMVTSELRKRAKAVNFGIVYGIGEFSLSDDLHISMKEAKEYIESYKASYPMVDKYLKDIVAEGYANGYVSTLYGRRRYIPELSGQNKMLKKFGERVAMNSPIQGTAADIIKVAMINVSRRLKEEGIDAHLILQVHDELLIESHRDCAEIAAKILREEMENSINLPVPLSVELTTGETWYDNK
ncbi:MAG: DNA polymerase I [Clostridia bacterium]|nr:DNA polymerase I [Clostridia bacterium]